MLSFLRENIFFKGLPEDLLQLISEISLVKTYNKGEEIFGEGERALGFYLILEGNVKIYKLSPKGKEVIIHLLSAGDIFAEIVLAGVETYPAYAQAITISKLAFFEKNRFLNLIQRKPELALRMIGLFTIKIKSLLKNIENLTLREARERLLIYLWDLSQEGNRVSFDLEINKAHLALLLGITPETLSRLFQKFREEGLLEIQQKRITL
ncbi:MAG: Crp/Fnr family transcriptional regulator, partial [Caldimicrobium sp.]